MAYSPFRTGDPTIDRNLDSIKAALDALSSSPGQPTETDWTQYTPVFAGMGTTASNACFYRRLGPDLFVRGVVVTGTVTSAEARIGLPQTPDVLQAADNKLIPSIMLAGYGTFGSVPGIAIAPTVLIQPGKSYFNLGYLGASNAGAMPLAGNSMFANNEAFYFYASCPIQGWSVNG